MGCPRCGAELDLEDLFTGGRHATVAGCAGCGGMWMRDTDLERLSEVVEPVLFELLRVAPSAQDTPLRCPECAHAPLMRKLHSSRDARVLLDSCDACGGVWLDGGELRAIQRQSLPALAAAFLRAKRSDAR